MWEQAPRWVRYVIGITSWAFASLLGIGVLVVLMAGMALEGCDVDLSFGEPDPNPELTAAIDRCDVAAVEAEITKGGRPFVDGRFNFYEDGPSLSEALECGPEMTELLVSYAVENGGGDSVLHAAVSTERPEIVEAVLAGGVDIDARDDAGDTALLDAVTDDDGAMLDLLLERGADPDIANDGGHTPLLRAVGFDRPLAVARLLAGGADPNVTARVTVFEIAAVDSLQRAAAGGEPPPTAVTDVVEALRPALGFDPADSSGVLEPVTPLYIAVALSSDAVVQALLDAGADPTIGSGPAGHLPADAAELLGRTELAARIRAAAG